MVKNKYYLEAKYTVTVITEVECSTDKEAVSSSSYYNRDVMNGYDDTDYSETIMKQMQSNLADMQGISRVDISYNEERITSEDGKIIYCID